jgi:hypothetical protein
MSESESHHLSRRQFLQIAGTITGGVAAAALAGCSTLGTAPATGAGGFTVSLHHDPADPIATSAPAQWALNKLRDALSDRGVTVLMRTDNNRVGRGISDSDLAIFAVGGASPRALGLIKLAEPESLALLPAPSGEPALIAAGADPLGLVYALTELTDRVTLASVPGAAGAKAALALAASISESRANAIRGIFRMFVSETEDKRWFYDRDGWQQYLDMLVGNRFNRFNLSFGLSYDFSRSLTDTYTFFMYPFFVSVPGYNVRAIARDGTPLGAGEMRKNLDTLRFISEQTALRGLQFNLGIWTHNYRWTSSPRATYTIDGLNGESQAPYSRDAMRLILQTCPGITGITLRTHGESGVPEGSYDLWKVIMSGVTGLRNADGSDRIIELDLHGKTMTPEMIDTALGTGMPVTISCKFSAEHLGLPYVQSSIRESEMPKATNGTGLMALSSGTRSLLRYGVGDLLRQDRKYKMIHRVWPGTQRLLLWGDPVYAAGYGRAGRFAGMDGIEYFEPLSFKGRGGSSMNIPPAADRSGYGDSSLCPEREWQKYLYTFRLWGRLSYNPDASAETWRRALGSKFGSDAPHYESALASASRILPLITTAHLPCAANYAYWPEIYVNMSLYDTTKVGSYGEAPNPKVFGNVSSLDPQIFASIFEYVDALLGGKHLAKINPLQVAQQLETWSKDTSAALARRVSKNDVLPGADDRRMETDAIIAAGIGQFFAHKFRAAILWQVFNLSGDESARAAATDAYKKARGAWSSLAATANVYLPDLTFGPERQLRRHWSERLADLDADIAGMATRTPQRHGGHPKDTINKLIQSIVDSDQNKISGAVARHTSPATFKPTHLLPLEIYSACDSVRLCYRHINQGERYTAVDMQNQDGKFTAAIPADYTEGKFHLQYYFEVRNSSAATLFPGFREDFTGTPYFIIPPA